MPVEEFVLGAEPALMVEAMHRIIRSYTRALEPDRRYLLEQHRFAHLARKVVGVGSVGRDAKDLVSTATSPDRNRISSRRAA